jgi:tetratricopeptide (TPR) repeat protein
VEPQPAKAIEVFYSYAREDENLRDELVKHLANLKRQGIITDWYDRDISAGKEWDEAIKKRLDSASVILLLISPDFMDSDYINAVEVRRAMERHEAGEARVIPVILRAVDWEGAPFSKLQALPTEARPVTSWGNRDEAFSEVTKGIRKAVQELSGPSANVPVLPDIPRPPVVGFVSRRDKDGRDIVERLREELAPQKNQLVALWGAGGVGKTTLAAEAVRELAETTGQRVIWTTADGRATFTFSTLLDDIAEQLGRTDLRPLAVQPKEEALRPLINASPTLIVLDNFETIPLEEALLCKEFLVQRARCPALITTRDRFDNALLIPFAAMSPDEANEYLKRLIAQTRDPDIYAAVDRHRILQTAEFNPLIIQWIVAQIDLAQEPEDVLSDLSHGEGDAAHRVFDRSFNLPQMAEGGRAVLLALSLFMPDATRPAVAEVAGMNLSKEKDKKRFKKAQQTLASLWLIKQTDGGQRLTVEGLTRELTKARLATDARVNMFHKRFVNRFLHYSQSNAKPIPSDLNAIEAERENILKAIDIAFTMEDWAAVSELVNTVGPPATGFLSLRGYWNEAIRCNEQGMVSEQHLGNKKNEGVYLGRAGTMYYRRGDYIAARNLLEQALEIARQQNDENNISDWVNQLGNMANSQGDLERASELYNESLAISKKLDDKKGIASCLHNLGNVEAEKGNLDEARKLYNESLKIGNALGDQNLISICLQNLGLLAHRDQDFNESKQLYNESLEIAKKLGDQSSIAGALHNLATLAETQGEIKEARLLYDESLKIAKKISDQAIIATVLHKLALLAQDQGDLIVANQLFNESLTINRKLGSQSEVAGTLTRIGILFQKQGDLAQASRLYNESLEIEKRIGNEAGVAYNIHNLGTLSLIRKDYQAAEVLFNESLNLLRKLDDNQNIPECLESIGNLKAEQNSLLEAQTLYDRALQGAQAIDDKFRIASVKRALGLLAERENDKLRAASLLRESLNIFKDLGSPEAKDVQQYLEGMDTDAP